MNAFKLCRPMIPARRAKAVETEVTKQQKQAIRDGNFPELKHLEKQLEQLFGAKERSFGAMWQHMHEHGS
jgi:hypothetical protein